MSSFFYGDAKTDNIILPSIIESTGNLSIINFPNTQTVTGNIEITNQLSDFATSSKQFTMINKLTAINSNIIKLDTTNISGTFYIDNQITDYASNTNQETIITELNNINNNITISNTLNINADVTVLNQLTNYATSNKQSDIQTLINNINSNIITSNTNSVSGNITITNPLTGYATTNKQDDIITQLINLNNKIISSNTDSVSGNITITNQITNYATDTKQTNIENELTTINNNILNCDTTSISGNVNMDNQITGYATTTKQLDIISLLETINSNVQICDTTSIVGNLYVDNQITGYATSTKQNDIIGLLENINSNIVTCNTSVISGSLNITNQINDYATNINQDTIISELNTLNTNIIECDTDNVSGSLTVTNQISGYATTTKQSDILTELNTLNTTIETCNTSAVNGTLYVDNQITDYATETNQNYINSNLTTLSNKITTCNTNNISGNVDILNPITDYALDSKQVTFNTSLVNINSNISISDASTTSLNDNIQQVTLFGSDYNTGSETYNKININDEGKLLINGDFTISNISTLANVTNQEAINTEIETLNNKYSLSNASNIQTTGDIQTITIYGSDYNVTPGNEVYNKIKVASNGSVYTTGTISIDTSLLSNITNQEAMISYLSNINSNITTCNTDNVSGNLFIDNISDLTTLNSIINVNDNALNTSNGIIIGGKYESTLTTVDNGDYSVLKTTNEGALITAPKSSSITLPSTINNSNVYVKEAYTGNYITNIDLLYDYNIINDNWERYSGEDIIRQYRANDNCYTLTYRQTNISVSSNGYIYILKNRYDTGNVYIYALDIELSVRNNVTSGNVIKVDIKCLDNIVLSSASFSSLIETCCLSDITLNDSNNWNENDSLNTNYTPTNDGIIISLMIGRNQSRVNRTELFANEFLRLRPSNGLGIYITSDTNDTFQLNITFRYIRTTDVL